MKSLIKNYAYKLLLILSISLIFMGFRDYFVQFSEGNRAVELFPSFFLAASMVLIYAIPFTFLIFYLAKKLSVSKNVLILSYIFAFTIPLYLGSEINSSISFVLFSLKVPQSILDNWGAALTAPFAEELAKVFVVVLVYFICKDISLKEAFISGMISGFGFQVLEDIAYIFQSSFSENNEGFKIAFERISNALGTHIAFSILCAVGIISLMKKSKYISKLKAILFILIPVAIHFIWNSPLEGAWVFPLFGSINLNLVYYAFISIKDLEE